MYQQLNTPWSVVVDFVVTFVDSKKKKKCFDAYVTVYVLYSYIVTVSYKKGKGVDIDIVSLSSF